MRTTSARASWRTKALELAQQIGDKLVQSGALNILAELAAEEGDEATANELYEQSLALRRELGDRRLIANSVLTLGRAELTRGDYDRATPLLQEGLALAKELQRHLERCRSRSSTSAASRCRANGDVDEAAALFGEALALAKERGDKRVAAECLQGLAASLGVRGDAAQAARLFGASEALLDSIGATPSAAEVATGERFVPFARDPLGDAQFEHERAAGAALVGRRRDRARAWKRLGGSLESRSVGRRGRDPQNRRSADASRSRAAHLLALSMVAAVAAPIAMLLIWPDEARSYGRS